MSEYWTDKWPPVGSPSLWAIIFASPVSANDVAVISAANSRARVQEPCYMAICLVPLNTLFGGCESATASKMGAKMGGDMMSRRRESKRLHAHMAGLSARSQRLIVNPTRSEESSCQVATHASQRAQTRA